MAQFLRIKTHRYLLVLLAEYLHLAHAPDTAKAVFERVHITDQPVVVNSSVNYFLVELIIAIIAVVVVIMLLLPLKVALIAAATIPGTLHHYGLGVCAVAKRPARGLESLR